ncbi:MAG: tellurite resistance TerB C-terminal domain-containing protein, partial [Prochlorococcus sp.]
YGLLRDNIIEEEYIKKSILIEYASNKRLMPNFLVDQINEIAIDTSGTLLLEEEDEEKYYISSEVLELIHSRLTPS